MYFNSTSRSFLKTSRQLKSAWLSRPLANSGSPVFSNLEQKPLPVTNHPSGSSVAPKQSLGSKEWSERLDAIAEKSRLPRSVQAVYLRPLRRKAEYGLPVCDLQLRSYSVRNVEFFADFAIRAAYYLKLPVSGPVPLPRIVERWTVPRSNFVHKKSQENFERVTLRRLIQIKDGHPLAVQAWLAFLRKHAFYGVGMKANIWDYESLDVAKSMDGALPEIEKSVEFDLAQFGQRKDVKTENSIFEALGNERFSHNKSPLTDVRRD